MGSNSGQPHVHISVLCLILQILILQVSVKDGKKNGNRGNIGVRVLALHTEDSSLISGTTYGPPSP